MMTASPPTDADIDAWASTSGIPRWLAVTAADEPGNPARSAVFAWTDAAGVSHFEHNHEPGANEDTAARLHGLRAVHGAVRVRVYSFTFPADPASYAAPAGEQDAANDPAQWAGETTQEGQS